MQLIKLISKRKKKMKPLTSKPQGLDENAKKSYICKARVKDKYIKDKKYCKVRDHCHYTDEYRIAAHSTCNLKYSLPEQNPYSFS